MSGRCEPTGPTPMTLVAIVAGVLVAAVAARAEDAPAADPALDAILEAHRGDVERLERRLLVARRERIDETLRRLKALQDERCREARLDEALAVREAIRGLERSRSEPSTASRPSASPAPDTLGWMAVEPGQEYLFTVTGSRQGPIWGTDRYTVDSRIGAAAVHAGALAVGETGVVKIIVEASPAEFVASERHGVSSGRWGRYRASFRVERVGGKPADRPASARTALAGPADQPVPATTPAPRSVPLSPLVPARPRAAPSEPAPLPSSAPEPPAAPAPDRPAPARRPFD